MIGDNDTPQQTETFQKIEKAVEIQYDLDMTQVDTATRAKYKWTGTAN